MGNIKWVKYNDKHQGPRYRGKHKYDPPKPWGPWTKVMGVVARCEGNHDTVVMYDGTGVTWGFLQWTFTSGRLQKMLESFKSIPHYDFTSEKEDSVCTLFDDLCCYNGGTQLFKKFGFEIRTGRFVDVSRATVLDPAKNKKRINDICLGKSFNTFKDQKMFAMRLAQLFADMDSPEAAAAQIQFAKHEFKRSLGYKRKPLGKVKTIDNLLPEILWETPVPGIFFNLWQNSPAGAYKLFLGSWRTATIKGVASAKDFNNGICNISTDPWDFFDIVWRRLNKTAYANWGWNSRRYKAGKGKPRITRIKPAIKEFYGVDLEGIDLKYYK